MKKIILGLIAIIIIWFVSYEINFVKRFESRQCLPKEKTQCVDWQNETLCDEDICIGFGSCQEWSCIYENRDLIDILLFWRY